MNDGVTYLARMAYRAPDPDTGGRLVETTRQLEFPTIDQARTLARSWARWCRAHRPPLDTPVIVVDTHRAGCTIATEDVPIYAHDDRPEPPAPADSIAKARATLAAASERRAAEYRGGFTP